MAGGMAQNGPMRGMRSVVSSNVESIGYDSGKRQLQGGRGAWVTVGPPYLYVRFRNGSCYRFRGVPYEIYHQMLYAASKGKFFWRWIKDRPQYPYERIGGL